MTSDSATEPKYGAWITLDSTVQTEQVARLGFDFVCIDGQHGMLGFSEIRNALVAVTAAGGPIAIVRVSGNIPSEIGRVLDAGARGVIVPMIETADDARSAAKAARYPISGGLRSYSPVRGGSHFGHTPAETDAGIFVLAMIETKEALANVDAILDTPGIDGVFVGPYDLSLGLGASVPLEDSIMPELDASLERILGAALERKKIAGVYAGSGEEAARRANQGFTMVNTAHDLRVLRNGMTFELDAARSGSKRA